LVSACIGEEAVHEHRRIAGDAPDRIANDEDTHYVVRPIILARSIAA